MPVDLPLSLSFSRPNTAHVCLYHEILDSESCYSAREFGRLVRLGFAAVACRSTGGTNSTRSHPQGSLACARVTWSAATADEDPSRTGARSGAVPRARSGTSSLTVRRTSRAVGTRAARSASRRRSRCRLEDSNLRETSFSSRGSNPAIGLALVLP